MLNQNFVNRGFAFVDQSVYVNEKNSPSLHDLKKIFDIDLEDDQGCHFRKRGYLKLKWNKKINHLSFHENQSYFQTKNSNDVDGGKIRKFKVMDKKILDIDIMRSLLSKDLEMIVDYEPLKEYDELTIGLHFIRYIVHQNSASFSSPDWLHKDDEPLVFIHLIGLSRFALGGDNLIADNDKKIQHVIRLENDMDTLILNKMVYHAVTPLGSKNGISFRDVILLTIEPSYTQVDL